MERGNRGGRRLEVPEAITFGDRQRPVVTLAEQDMADHETILRPVGQDLRADRPVEAVDAPHQGDHEPFVLASLALAVHRVVGAWC